MTQSRGVDVHAHFVCPEVFKVTDAMTLTLSGARDPATSPARRAEILRHSDRIVAEMADFDARIAAMDAMGVARQVASPSLVHQCTYHLPPGDSLALERVSNDWIAAQASRHADRIVPLGSAPLHAPELAVEELKRCMGALGLRGVAISTRAGAREIGDPALHAFWREAEALSAAVYIHPAGNPEPRFAPFALWNSVGQCFEETMAVASLIYEGVLERFPRLRICVSHGGGYMPHNMGRIDRNWIEKPATRANMPKPPTDYLKMLWFDSCVYDADVLRHLVEKVGDDRVLLGSDYPVGEKKPVAFIEACGFDAQATEKIVAANARDWLGE